MIQISKILCPVDFFPTSEYAAAYAAGLAKDRDARLKLLHVVSPVIPTAYEYPLNMADVIAGLKEASERELNRVARKFRTLGLDVETEVRTGRIVDGIKTAIAKYKPDLVVMGAHGRKNLGRWFLGSTTERLLRQSPAPLLTISASRARVPDTGFRRILVTTDFSDGTVDALNHAFSLAQENQARLTLLHVVQEPAILRNRLLVRELENKLDKLIPREVRDWCTVEAQVAAGTPYQRILEIVKKEKIDLLVMNIHGKGMFERALLGSNAERVVRAAACPVLLIPPMPKTAKARARKRAA